MDDPRDVQRYTLGRTREQALPIARVDWGAELNEQQRAAVAAPDGPVLVLAGAGSGKTRVITYRVAYLLTERRIKPQQVMLATFTNKAARSMLGRCEEAVGPAARDVTGGTFHHIANLLLRRYARRLDYESNFSILDDSDAASVMKVCRAESGVDLMERAFPSAKLLVKIASAVVNTHTDLESLLTRRFPHLCERLADIERVLVLYHERKFTSNQMDFDDLLVNWLRLLTEQPEVRATLARRYQHILVDEYQDVNHIQAAIVRELYLGESSGGPTPGAEGSGSALDDADELPPPEPAVEPTEPSAAPSPEPPSAYLAQRGLFVVGDDAQSIYSFRGADYHNIRSFPDVFPQATVYKLEVNYRSVPEVLNLANGVLDEADPQFKKELSAVKPAAAERPLLLACRDADEEAEFIAEQILKLREETGMQYRQLAVLYRAHANRLQTELELTQRGIPFMVRGGLRFFEQAHIKDLLSYVVVLANSTDELAWQRMLSMCTRVGPKTIASVLSKIRGAEEAEGGTLGRFIHNGVADSARGQAKQALTELRDYLRKLAAQDEKLPVSDLIQQVLEGRYQSYLEMNYENWRQRLDDIEQLIVYAARFDTLTGFLSDIGLTGEIWGHRDMGGVEQDPEEGAVTLSTIHQAKGLEWKVVFVIHVQDDVLPHRMSRGDADAEDEERRLLYVAITRAEEALYITYPQMTETRDYQRLINRPSRFLTELPPSCYDEAVLDWE